VQKRSMPYRSLFVGLLLTLGSTVLPASAQKALHDMHFTFANVLEQGEMFKQLGDGLMRAADTVGVKVTRYNNNNDGMTTSNNARLMVQQRPDVIIEYTGIEGIGESLRRTFTRANLPFIAVNVPIPGGHWFNLVNREIGEDTARIVGQAALDRGWTAQDTTVIIVQAAFAGAEVNDCVRYFDGPGQGRATGDYGDDDGHR